MNEFAIPLALMFPVSASASPRYKLISKFLNSPDIRSAPIAGTKILSSCISEDLSTLTISWQANLYDTAGIIFLGLILK